MGGFFKRRVTEVLLTANQPGTELAMVRFDDGGYGVRRNGELLAGYYWPGDQVDACVETFMRLADIPGDGHPGT